SDVRSVADVAQHGEAPFEVHAGDRKLALGERDVTAVVLGEREQTRVAEARAAFDAGVEDRRRALEVPLRVEIAPRLLRVRAAPSSSPSSSLSARAVSARPRAVS